MFQKIENNSIINFSYPIIHHSQSSPEKMLSFFGNVFKCLQTSEGICYFVGGFLLTTLLALPVIWLFMEPPVVLVGVYVGRFQPLTNAHLASIIHFLSRFNEMILLIGSHGLPEYNHDNDKPVNPKNPYNTAIRRQMILEALTDYLLERKMDLTILKKLTIRGIHDSNHKHGYAPDKCNFSAWNSDFNNIVCEVLESKYPTKYFETSTSFDSHFDVHLCGSEKDKATQDYLRKIRLGSDGSDGTPAIVGVNYNGNPYLIEYLIEPICVGVSSQTVDATTIRSLITRINEGETKLMTELERWVPAATIRVLQEHQKLIKIE